MNRILNKNQVSQLVGLGLMAYGACYSNWAFASFVECDAGHLEAACRVNMLPGLTLETTVGAMNELGTDHYEIHGDISLVTGTLRLPLRSAEVVVELGDNPQLYGESEVPLSEMPLLGNVDFQTVPRAALGLANGATLAELIRNDDLPLNDSLSESGTLRDSSKPYLFFHMDAGVSFKLDFGEQLKLLNDVAFTIPGSFTATAIFDVFDPYFYLSYTRTEGIDLNSIKRKPDQQDGLIVYEIKDESGEEVAMTFTLDPETGVMEERNYVADTRIYYERNADGDYVQQNVESDPMVLSGEQFKGLDRKHNKDDKDGNQDDKGGDFIDAIGFSTNGWIHYEAKTTGSLPDDVSDFAGQIYLHGDIPLSPAVSLQGDVITYLGEQGVAQGGNGEVSLGIPGLPDWIDFDIRLGNASAAVQVMDHSQKVFVAGELDPDTAFLTDIMPIMPVGKASVQGYIGDDLENTQLNIEGEMGLGADLLGELIGVNMNELAMTRARMSVDADGIEISGSTNMQISPDIRVNSAIDVYAAFDWNNPEDVRLRLTGNMELFGVALEDVTLDVSSAGMFVNGAFVTPASRIELSGSITSEGPQMAGSAAIALDLGDLSGAIADATAALDAAQREVARINADIAAMRATVQAERDRDQKALTDAQAAVSAAQNKINSINRSISAHSKAIRNQKASIASWYRWYKKAAWHQKAARYARYLAEKTKKTADIARRNAAIAGLKVARTAANAALEAAKLALEGVKKGMVLTPIDLDPRIAALFVARDAANVALEAAKKPLENMPVIDTEIRGEISLQLGVQGISGEVTASITGYPPLHGRLVLAPRFSACITVPGLGEACTVL